jgi:pimeloyl-ACP methyl ester carboxylesterase
LSAIPERQWLGESHGIYWWDQPRPTTEASRPFLDLVDAAQAEFTRRAIQAGGKMALLANSFGAVVALRLACRVPQHISAIILLSPVHDLGSGFIRFARRLAGASEQHSQLLAAAEALAAKKTDREKFWNLVANLLGTPGFADLYWSAAALKQRQWFGALLGDPAVFDFNAFQMIVNDLFLAPEVGAPVDFCGPVSILFGNEDVLIDMEDDRRIWQSFFPHAAVNVVNAGHFIHMELPPVEWLEPAR